ncbi:unnamed protein product [Ceratitis capitata]|uniref:(Mediterranean fruit fly) hypothetical protein n=1 Tax=Ceratitis capitata TaxID=7213 RepID=A0A811UER5_CERCA|nr:unnamed protein product [Ceratitis capitata]
MSRNVRTCSRLANSPRTLCGDVKPKEELIREYHMINAALMMLTTARCSWTTTIWHSRSQATVAALPPQARVSEAGHLTSLSHAIATLLSCDSAAVATIGKWNADADCARV